MGLTEAVDIKKRWQEYTEELYKKELHDQDNHLEPDILECEVKWALRSITMNKAAGGNGIPIELFQILNSGHRTGKGQFSFQSQRKAMTKNVQSTAQLHSSHTLAK